VRRRTDSLSHFQRTAPLGETARERCRIERIEVGFTRERNIQQLKSPGRLEQQRRSVVAVARSERDLGAKHVDLRAPEPIERSRLGDANQSKRRIERAGFVLGLGRGQRALTPPRRLDR
jgi:hypothetical protein